MSSKNAVHAAHKTESRARSASPRRTTRRSSIGVFIANVCPATNGSASLRYLRSAAGRCRDSLRAISGPSLAAVGGMRPYIFILLGGLALGLAGACGSKTGGADGSAGSQGGGSGGQAGTGGQAGGVGGSPA